MLSMYLINTSLIITGVSLVLRFCLLKQYPKIVFVQDMILKFLLKKPSLHNILCRCHALTFLIFTGDPYKPRQILIWFSGLFVGFGIVFRLMLTQGFFSQAHTFILFLLGINGIFRGLINLGILLNNYSIWKQLLERALQNGARSAGRTASEFSSNQPRNNLKIPENPNNPKTPENTNENTEENNNNHKRNSQYHGSSRAWTTAIGLATIFGGIGTIYNSFDVYDRRSRDPETPENVKALKNANRELEERLRRAAEDKERNHGLVNYILEREARQRREFEKELEEAKKSKN